MRDSVTLPDTASIGVDEATTQPSESSPPAPASSHVALMMDRAVARLLSVEPQQGAATRPRSLDTPLLLVGLRCIARYIVLPFALPLTGAATGAALGIVTGAALGILVVLDLAAVTSIIATLRWLWRHQHPRRWQYLPLALALTLLIALFLVNDTRTLVA